MTLHQIREFTRRADVTLMQDTLGAGALTVMLVVCLYVPSFF